MSWLLFVRKSKRIYLFSGKEVGALVSSKLGEWPANNDTTSTSKGKWPIGTFKWEGYKPHAELAKTPGCFSTAFGCNGIHLFNVPNRPGMGVHSGRITFDKYPIGIGGKTLGCIRVSDEAMSEINKIHTKDPLISIKVQD